MTEQTITRKPCDRGDKIFVQNDPRVLEDGRLSVAEVTEVFGNTLTAVMINEDGEMDGPELTTGLASLTRMDLDTGELPVDVIVGTMRHYRTTFNDVLEQFENDDGSDADMEEWEGDQAVEGLWTCDFESLRESEPVRGEEEENTGMMNQEDYDDLNEEEQEEYLAQKYGYNLED